MVSLSSSGLLLRLFLYSAYAVVDYRCKLPADELDVVEGEGGVDIELMNRDQFQDL